MNLSSELILFCRQHETDDVYTLALQAHLYPNIDIETAIRQIKGRQIAKKKLPSWYTNEQIVYPVHLSLEQASSEQTGRYKQELCREGEKMVDLTGGLGVDCYFLSQRFNETVYVEQQAELATLAQSNFEALGLSSIKVVNNDAVDYLQNMEQRVDLIYIDPARRNTKGNKIFLIEDCTPNLLDIQDALVAKAECVMIKLSPMLDVKLSLSRLKNVSRVDIVSVDNEVKELLFFVKEGGEVQTLCCTNIKKEKTEIFTFTLDEEATATIKYTSDIKRFLYEPNASIMKGGAYKLIAHRFGLEKLHVNSHLYISNVYVDDFPGRIFEVRSVSSFGKKDLKKHLAGLDKINITVRNFPISVDALRRKLKLAEGGNDYLFATTIDNNQKVLVFCSKLN